MNNSMPFRSDINGLRAWAVLAVVLFHFGAPGLSGGFVGVDIFFVISGFLMTNIIVRELEAGQFSFLGFYLARASRIVPALLVLCAVLLIMGWYFLPSNDYQLLGMHTLTSVLFASNIQYWREAGYFDVTSHDKWLLHTWSLSVEWQFYLVLPLLLWGGWKLSPKRRFATATLGALLLISFIFSVWLTAIKPEAAFFLLPTRAWEMLAGGIVALYLAGGGGPTTPRNQSIFEGFGFFMLALSIVSARPTYWPGAVALLPVLGTSLVLLAQRQRSLLTTPFAIQRVGDCSYSIYLWHWPIAVTLVYGGWQGQPVALLLGLGFSLLLGWMSYRWAEPLGRKKLSNWRTGPKLAVLAVFCALLGVPALSVRLLHGVPGRLNPEVENIAAAADRFNPFREKSHTQGGVQFKSHVYGGPNIRAVVWGDSHASTIVTAVQAALKDPKDGVLGMSYTSCPTLFGVRHERQDFHCAEFNEWAMGKIAELPIEVPVVIVNRNSAYLFGNQFGSNKLKPIIYFDDVLRKKDKKYQNFLKEYSDHFVASACKISKTRRVFMLRPLPEMPQDVPRSMTRAALLGRSLEISMPLAVYHQRNEFVWSVQDRAEKECGVNLLNPLPLLCKDGLCRGSDGGVPYYYDDNHLSEDGNRGLVSIFSDFLI